MSFSKVTKSACIYVLASLLLPLSCVPAQSANTAPVPAAFAQEYNALNQAVGTFQTSLDSRTQSRSATTFSSKLMCADASQGADLLRPAALKEVAIELAQYKKMGIQGVVIHTGFPILTPAFFNAINNPNLGTYQQYMAFYQQVFQLCHAAGMKVMIESHPLFPFGGNAFAVQVQNYIQKLSSKEYQNEVAQNNANLATLGPDFISIVSEPNTDAAWTNQTVYTSPTLLAAFVQASTTAIKAANPKVETAAGSSNWQKDSVQFDQLFCQIPTLDAIDIHIYFAGNNELEYATTLADSARSMGKKIVVSECWLTTVGQGMPPATALTNNQQANTAMSQNCFSFWQPLNLPFIYSFFKWCNVENPQFFTFFYTQLLFANLDYSQYGSQSSLANDATEEQMAHANLNAGICTPVGVYYSSMLTAPRQNHY